MKYGVYLILNTGYTMVKLDWRISDTIYDRLEHRQLSNKKGTVIFGDGGIDYHSLIDVIEEGLCYG